MSTTPEHHAARIAVAEEVLSLMGRRRVSQTTLAKHLGMSQPALSKRLSGRQPFTLDELLATAAYFDIEVTSLFVSITQGGSPLPWITTPPNEDVDAAFIAMCEGQLDLLDAA